MLGQKTEHFEKNLGILFFFGILPFTSVVALSFATWNIWEKWNILRKRRTFCEKPYRSSPPFPRLSRCENFENFLYQVGMGFDLHTQVSLVSKTPTLTSNAKWWSPKCQWWCHKWHTENAEKGLCIHTVKSLQVWACSPGEPSTRFGPQCDCHAHRQRTKLAWHFRCNGGNRFQLHMQTDWKMKCHCTQWTYFFFHVTVYHSQEHTINKAWIWNTDLRHSHCDCQALTSLEDLRRPAYQLAMQVPAQHQLGKDISSQDCSILSICW